MSYEYRFRLGLSSVDRAGVLFYPELFRHAHDAYEVFMAHLGEDLSDILAEESMLLPIVHAEADFHRPLRHGEDVTVRVRVVEVGESSYTMGFEFVDGSGALCASVRSVHVCVDLGRRSPVALPEGLREKLVETGM